MAALGIAIISRPAWSRLDWLSPEGQPGRLCYVSFGPRYTLPHFRVQFAVIRTGAICVRSYKTALGNHSGGHGGAVALSWDGGEMGWVCEQSAGELLHVTCYGWVEQDFTFTLSFYIVPSRASSGK